MDAHLHDRGAHAANAAAITGEMCRVGGDAITITVAGGGAGVTDLSAPRTP